MMPVDRQFVEKLNRLIDDNLDSPSLSVDSICQAVGISRSHLHRTIKEQTGLSTSLHIRKRRLLRASTLLITSNLRISEIGDRVGITNPQNFSTYFVEEFKVTPTAYRKQHAELAAVTQPLPSSASTPAISVPPVLTSDKPVDSLSIRTRLLRRQLIWGIVIAVVVLIVGVGLFVRYVGRANVPDGNSLAVLQFTNLGTAESNVACEGITDDVHTSVSFIKNLKVISRSSSDQYKDTKKSVGQIGDELQVANILKGSVLKTADQIQIKVELISTHEASRAWSKKYSAAYKNIFQLTDQIVRDVASQLTLATEPTLAKKTDGGRTRNLNAYNALVQGRQLLVSRLEPDLQASLSCFDRALALDSTFGDAYAGKAVAYHLLIGSKKIDTPTLNRLTEENALKAIQFDPINSTAYGVLGSLYYSTYQWQASENAYRIALQHNPNDAQVNHWYALLMRTTGRLDEAVRYSTQAMALDPLHPVIRSAYISNCSLAGQFQLAHTGMETGQVLFNKSFAFQLGEAYYWLCRADYNRAAAHFQQMIVLNPDDKGQLPILMYCEAKRGNHQKAAAFLRNLNTITPRSDYERAVVYAGLNQADSSLHYLKKAADGGYLYRDTKVIPVFASYRKHPIFRAVMRQYHLSEQ